MFECKNYAGNIYADGYRKCWLQYLGKQKNYFYSPILQNKNHAKYLAEFLVSHNDLAPIIPLIVTTRRGKWHVKNLSEEDYMLGINCRFSSIYSALPMSPEIMLNYDKIMAILTPLTRVSNAIKRKHIEQIKGNSR